MVSIKSKTIISFIFAILLIIMVFLASNPRKTLEIISGINLFYYFFSFIIYFSIFFLYGYRWKILINSSGESASTFILTKLIFIGSALNFVFPGRVGDITRAYYLKDKNSIKVGKGFATIIIEKVYDIFFLLCITLLLLPAIQFKDVPSFVWSGIIVAIFSVFFFLGLLLIIILKPHTVQKILPKISWLLLKTIGKIKLNLANRIINKVNSTIVTIAESLSLIGKDKRSFAIVSAVTIILWSQAGFSLYFVFLAIGLSPPILKMFFVLYLGTLLGYLLPITPGGMGTVEIVFISLFISILNYENSLSVAVVLLYRFITFGLVIPIGVFSLLSSSLRESILREESYGHQRK